MRNFFIRSITCFIPSKRKRRELRNKYLQKKAGNEVLLQEITNLNSRFDKIEQALLASWPQATGGLRTLQLEMYDLLVFLKTICLENNLQYWIQGGTLLGAVRHHGFIPWDDDMDCGMMRSDLNKLKELIKNNNEYEIIDCYNLYPEISFACKMPKLVKKGKQFIFLDIFPYDYANITEDPSITWEKFQTNRANLNDELVQLNFKNPDCPIKDNIMLEKVQSIIDKYIPQEIDKNKATHIIWGIENLKSNYCKIYNKNEIFPLVSLLFEDDIFTAPSDYMGYLTRSKGNIMSLPNDIGRGLRHLTYAVNEKEHLTKI